MNMIEKVARASFACWQETNGSNFKFEELNTSEMEFAIKHARVCIEAMREPTEGMVKPVVNADGFFKLSDPVRAWELMIDAALKEE